MQPVLISGASGLIGQSLERILAAQRIPTRKLVRSPSPGAVLWNPAADQPFASTAPLEGARAAIHLSGASVAGHRWTPAYKREIYHSRVRSTHALATALAALRQPPEVLLCASAIGYYGDRGAELLTEQSAPGTGFLAETCVAWEQAADPARVAGIRVVHLRLGVVLTPHGGALRQMLPVFRLGLGGRLGSGRQWMSWIAFDDVLRAILDCLQDQPSHEPGYHPLQGPVNLVAPHPVTNAEFTRALARALRRPAFAAVPAFGLRLAFGQVADEALLASTRVVPAQLQDTGFQFTQPYLDGALHMLLNSR